MATRRMISKDVCSSDDFLDMPKTSQCLYFHLVLNSDDEGFVSPRQIMRAIGADNDDIKVLISKRFVIPFATGVIVIRHWKMMNCIKKDRFKGTIYLAEKARLKTDKNKAYYKCLQSGTNLEPQYSIEQYSIEQYSEDECRSVNPPVRLTDWNNTQDAVRRAIDYNELIADNAVYSAEINGIVNIIVTAILSNEPAFMVNGSSVPYTVMKDTLLSLTYENIIEVIKKIKHKCVDDERFTATNRNSYVLSALFNSATTSSLFEK